MSFLAPLFLVGALAVAAPIVFHLIRRTSREKVTFSSLMFLQPTPPRVTRSSKVENIFLLILRCLALCLLALGFSRPFIQKPVAADPAAGQGERILVLLDASASMRRDGLWADAQGKAEQTVRRVTPSDSLAVYLFDRGTRPILSFEQWAATPAADRINVALERIAAARPGWAGTHLGPSMLAAVDALEDTSGKAREKVASRRRIVLISDLQEGARLDGLQGFEWPRGVEVSVESVKARRPTNAGLQLLAEQDESVKPSGDNEIKVRIANSSDAKREQFQVGWARPGETTFSAPPVDAYVPPGQSRVFTAPRRPGGQASPLLRLTGDEEDFDNVVHYLAPRTEQIKVIFVGNDDPGDSQRLLYYLQRAFPQTRRQNVQVIASPPDAPLPPDALVNTPLVVVADALSPSAGASVRTFLETGGTVLFVVKSITLAQSLGELSGLSSVSAEESQGGNYALLGQLDFDHPLLAPFADPRFSDFTKIHFWKYRRLDPAQFAASRMIARFDGGAPALMQVPVGKGSLLVLTSGWNPADSQLALSSKFVPLLYSLLDLGGGMKSQMAQYTIGDPVALNATNTSQSVVVRNPEGIETTVAPPGRFSETALPGLYDVVTGSSTQRFAVNLDPTESRTSPMTLEELERLRLPLQSSQIQNAKADEQKKLNLQSTELEQRQKLWRWLLVAALIVLIAETWLAGWLTRRNQPVPA